MRKATVIATGSWLRQLHRWVSIAFTVTVLANFIVRAKGTPPPWVTYAPLVPLAVLLLTGLYLFVLPYTVRRRSWTGA
jgi:hypothetical protein